jgi:thioredoxin 1
MTDKIPAISSDLQFEREVLSAAGPAVVWYYGQWCPHCRALTPVMERLVDEYGKDLPFFRVDVDDRPELADRYGIQGVPTVCLFRDGQVAHQCVGEMDEAEYRQVFDDSLARRT